MPDSVYWVIIPLIAGYLLDLLFGDPRKLPHPVVWFGNMIIFSEKHLNRGDYRWLKGCLVAFVLPAFVFTVSTLLSWGAGLCGIIPYCILASVAVFYGLANHSLIQEGREVIETLEKQGLEAGRARLSWIVGRDTSRLTPKQIYTAVLETMAENLSDGVVAPLFYYAIGGFPAMLTYKMVNTLDSMIGYKNERYRKFGCYSARLDDALNYLPARITALLIALIAYRPGIFGFIFRNAYCHASPNSGFPESAMAGVLNCRFGGPNIYHGILVQKPYIGTNDREIEYKDYQKVARINQAVTLVSITLIAVLWYIFTV